jgi:hypothetical protein
LSSGTIISILDGKQGAPVVFLWLGKTSIIIMDNCGIHWSQRVLDMCQKWEGGGEGGGGGGEEGNLDILVTSLLPNFEPN